MDRAAEIVLTLVVVTLTVELLGLLALTMAFGLSATAAAIVMIAPALLTAIVASAIKPIRGFVMTFSLLIWPF